MDQAGRVRRLAFVEWIAELPASHRVASELVRDIFIGNSTTTHRINLLRTPKGAANQPASIMRVRMALSTALRVEIAAEGKFVAILRGNRWENLAAINAAASLAGVYWVEPAVAMKPLNLYAAEVLTTGIGQPEGVSSQ